MLTHLLLNTGFCIVGSLKIQNAGNVLKEAVMQWMNLILAGDLEVVRARR